MFDAEDPGTRPELRRGGVVSPRPASARSAPSAPTPRRARRRAIKGGGVGPSPAYSLQRRGRRGRGRSGHRHGVTVPKVWIAHDIGRALNPALALRPGRGQRLHGPRRGADGGEALPPAAALGFACPRPQVPVDARVQEPDHAGDAGGRRPTSSRIPDPSGPFGAKEVGQGPLLPIMPAVANAVYDAVGVRVDEIPITPEKVAQGARGEGAREARARYGPDRFPDIDYRETLSVPTPWQGGDGKAINDPDAKRREERAGQGSANSTEPRGAMASAERRSGRVGCAMMRLPTSATSPRTRRRGRRSARRPRPGRRCSSPAAPTSYPNMKRRQQTPKIARRALRGIAGAARGTPRQGPGARRRDDADRDRRPTPRVQTALRRVLPAAAQIATPQLRNMGTVGGNLCLDTRCNYYDQTYEWREAIGFCMKKDGDTCWVAPGERRAASPSRPPTPRPC